MNNAVKSFIEDNIDTIDSGDFIKILDIAYEAMYDNQFVRNLTMVFETAGIDLFEAREDRLYTMLERICVEAVTGGENNLHRALDEENNWYGYDIHNVIDFLDQMQYNLGVQLVPITERIFRAPNYFIMEND